jgi:hypothetical protein
MMMKLFIQYLILICYSIIITSASVISSVENHKIACHIDVDHILKFMQGATQEKIATEWSHLHKVTDFKFTDIIIIENTNLKNYEILEKYRIAIRKDSVVYYARFDYKTQIKMPSILHRILKTNIEFTIKKEIFSVDNVIHIISQIKDVPLIAQADIYSMFRKIGTKYGTVRSLVTHNEIPWYANFAAGTVKSELEKSLKQNVKLIFSHFC